MTWKQLTDRDYRQWKLSAIFPHDSQTWRSGVRSAMHAASQLPGSGVSVFLGLNHLDHWTWTGPSDYQLDQMGCISWTNSSWTKS